MYIGFENISEDGSTVGHGIIGKVHNITTLTTGVVGNAIYVNGINQRVTFGSHKDRCFGNTSICDDGFSLAFWLKLGERPVDKKCKRVLNSMDIHHANGFSVCLFNSGKLRASVTLERGKFKAKTNVLAKHIWHHLGITWINAAGLTILLNGAFHSNTPDITKAPEKEWPHETEVTLGALARDPIDAVYMAEVTVDELYFWEKWMTNLAMWKVYARSTFEG